MNMYKAVKDGDVTFSEKPASMYDRINAGEFTTKLPYGKTREENTAWRADDKRLDQLARVEMAKEAGILGHPKEPKVWSLAWDYGHSAGLHEVWMHYQDLAELLD